MLGEKGESESIFGKKKGCRRMDAAVVQNLMQFAKQTARFKNIMDDAFEP
jgi:hypothetical protein